MAITFDGTRCEVSSKFRDSARLLTTWQGLVVKDGKVESLGTVLSYVSLAGNTNYACLFLYGLGESCHGYGRATGWGYNRKGAAIRAAIRNAGIEGAPNAEADEWAAIRAVFEAVARAQGLDTDTLFVASASA